MRRYVFGIISLLALALIEASLLPAALGGGVRPSLVLIFSSVWAAVCGVEGFGWAFAGGFMLDLMSSLPVGLFSFSLLIGNVVATVLDRAPIPSPSIRAATWVALATVVSNGLIMAGLALSGSQVDILYAMTNVVLPLLIINPILALPVYFVLSRVNLRLRARQL